MGKYPEGETPEVLADKVAEVIRDRQEKSFESYKREYDYLDKLADKSEEAIIAEQDQEGWVNKTFPVWGELATYYLMAVFFLIAMVWSSKRLAKQAYRKGWARGMGNGWAEHSLYADTEGRTGE